jgi:hypothetical protein
MHLSTFLSELTAGLSPRAIHERVLRAVLEDDHDERLDLVLADPEAFAVAWQAVLLGVDSPADGWERVVLPVMLAFSEPSALKNNLEQAANLWLAMRHAGGEPYVGAARAMRPGWLPIDPDEEPGFDEPAAVTPAGPTVHKRRRTWLAPTAFAISAAVVLLVMKWLPAGGGPVAQHSPGEAPLATPPSAGVTQGLQADASPMVSALPPPPIGGTAPEPTWTGSGPVSPPSAPLALVELTATSTSVSLTWQSPADPGTGGVSYYRIYVDGVDAGWTRATSLTVVDLKPATTYTFFVCAVSGAGVQSPPSNAVTVTTLDKSQAAPTQTPTRPPTATPTHPIPPTNGKTLKARAPRA